MSFNEQDGIDLIKGLPEALLITSDDGNIVYVNHALESLTGFLEQELVDHHVSVLMPSGERERLDVVAWFERWANNPNSDQLRYLSLDGVTKSGSKLRFRVRVSSYQKDSDTFFVVILQDVTEEYQTTIDMRHAQLVNNRILAIGEDAVMTVDDSHIVRYWNKKAESVFGYTSDEICGKNFNILVPGPYSERHEQQVNDFASGPEASKLMGNRAEIKGLHKDGHEIPLEASITKTTIEGKLLISAQIRDITKRKQTEAALREKENHFRAIFENAIEAMALLSPDGEVLEINLAAKILLPKSESPLGKKFWMLNWWQDADEQLREELKDNLNRVKQGETHRVRVELNSEDGIREVDFSLKAASDSAGNTQFIIAEGRDLTSLSELA